MAENDNEDLQETTLSPEVRRIRNSIIKKFAHEPLDIMAKFVKDVVENEPDTVKRLGAMAARVEILRMRISQIADSGKDVTFDDIIIEETEEHKFEDDSSEIVITSPNLTDWVRLRIVENSEINGVRFPKGVVIDVSQEDGDRLLESGKASYVNEDEIADIKSDLNLKQKIDQKPTNSTDDDLEELDEDNKVGEDSEEVLDKDVTLENVDNILEDKETVGKNDQHNKVSEKGDELSDPESPKPTKNSDDLSEDKTLVDEEESISVDKETEPNESKKTKRKTKSDTSSEKTVEPKRMDEKIESSQESEDPAKESDDSPDAMLEGFDLESDDSQTK